MNYCWERGEKKSPDPGGIGTHILSVMRRVLYRCATTGAQEHGLNTALWELFLLLKEFLASFFCFAAFFSRLFINQQQETEAVEKKRRRCLNQRFMSPFSFKPWKRSNKGFALIFAFALFQFWVELARAWARKPELIVRLEINKGPLSSPSKLFFKPCKIFLKSGVSVAMTQTQTPCRFRFYL